MNTSSEAPPILVAVDFSDYSEAALVWAAKTAYQSSANLLVLHVVHDPASSPGHYAQRYAKGSPKKALRRLEEAATEMLATFMDGCSERHPDLSALADARTILVIGIPSSRIIQVAKREGAQQIVVGSQGRTGLARLLLGSKAQRVAQLSPVPVTIVKVPEDVKVPEES